MSIFYREQKIYLTDLEMQLIESLRKRRITEKEHPGQLTFHFDDDLNIARIELNNVMKG